MVHYWPMHIIEKHIYWHEVLNKKNCFFLLWQSWGGHIVPQCNSSLETRLPFSIHIEEIIWAEPKGPLLWFIIWLASTKWDFREQAWTLFAICFLTTRCYYLPHGSISERGFVNTWGTAPATITNGVKGCLHPITWRNLVDHYIHFCW